MTHSTKKFVLAFVAAVMMAMPCMAQDAEPPFTWAGKGTASLISEYGTEEIDLQFELSIDEQGMVEGQTSSEDGTSKIKHVFYTEKKQYDLPGFFARKLVIVLLINEYGDHQRPTPEQGDRRNHWQGVHRFPERRRSHHVQEHKADTS